MPDVMILRSLYSHRSTRASRVLPRESGECSDTAGWSNPHGCDNDFLTKDNPILEQLRA